MDIVRIFQQYCIDKGYDFRYGDEAHMNLLQGDLDPQLIHLLLFPVERSAGINKTGTKINKVNYKGSFMLVVHSDYALHYFNELDKDETVSKFTINIEPLIRAHMDIGNEIMCNELSISRWECKDVINIMDANKDGIYCQFNISRDE